MKIEVDIEEYITLNKRDMKLDFLECAGVDNWSGYGDALFPDEDFYDEDYDGLVVCSCGKIMDKGQYPYVR